MAYTTINKSTDHFNTLLYTGNGQASRSVTGVGFQPDWVWFKNRNTGDHHKLFDVIRGANKVLYGNLTAQEATVTQELQSFNSDGFTVGTESAMNGNGNGIVAWNWKAGGAASANSSGTISSSVSVNTTAGFSVVSYTGTGSAGATVGHGLGAVPQLIIEKARTVTDDWLVYHQAMGNTHGMALNNTTAQTDSDTYFNDTSPTSTVFSLGNNGKVNTNGATHIAYCFTEKTGFSKFGSYKGNGNNDGPFVYTGFAPAYVVLKVYSGTTGGWYIFDNKRPGYNSDASRLLANDTNTDAGTGYLDINSNGFKLRHNADDYNGNNYLYLYMAFAAAPLVGSNNIPSNAR